MGVVFEVEERSGAACDVLVAKRGAVLQRS